jgi:AcrR family transcriptional regulator
MPTGTPTPRTANRRLPRRRQDAGTPRSRICAAMLEMVSRQGYETTTVSDLISLIGMSRKTFYEHFEDRRSCFIWVCEHVESQWLAEASQAIAAAEEGSRTRALLDALLERAIAQPGALRCVMLEAAVVRPQGPELRERVIADWSALLAQSLRDDFGGSVLGPDLAGAIFGAIVRMVQRRLPAGVKPRAPRRRQLNELLPALVDWAACHVSHPPPPRQAAPRENGSAVMLFGGRAPGTLAVSSRSSGRRGLPRGENPISRSFVIHSQRERILDAVANLAAEKGYADLTIPDIVQEAAVSVQAFYEHFSGKEDAFLVAYEVGHRRALVAFEQAFDSQEDWPSKIQAGLRALYGFFASEPSFAHCALVDAPSVSERAALLLEQGIAAYVPMFEVGFAESDSGRLPPAIAGEAITSALHELCFTQVARGRASECLQLVPEAVYLSLAPFLGAASAAQIAAGGAATSNGATTRNRKKKPTPAPRGRKRQS